MHTYTFFPNTVKVFSCVHALSGLAFRAVLVGLYKDLRERKVYGYCLYYSEGGVVPLNGDFCCRSLGTALEVQFQISLFILAEVLNRCSSG